MNTIDQDAPLGRRKRRRYTDEFKADVVAACQGPGVSVAAIALMHKTECQLAAALVGQSRELRNDERQ